MCLFGKIKASCTKQFTESTVGKTGINIRELEWEREKDNGGMHRLHLYSPFLFSPSETGSNGNRAKGNANIRRSCKLHDQMQFVICHKFFNSTMQAFRVMRMCVCMFMLTCDLSVMLSIHCMEYFIYSRCIRWFVGLFHIFLGDTINPQNNETYSHNIAP